MANGEGFPRAGAGAVKDILSGTVAGLAQVAAGAIESTSYLSQAETYRIVL